MQVWTPFRADIYKSQGNAALGEGIGRGLVSVGDAIGRAIDKKQRAGKISDQLSKLLETAYPDRADEFKTWSLEQKQGFLEGEAVKSAQRKEQRDIDRLLADEQEQAMRMELHAAQLADRAAAGRVPGRMMELLRPQMEPQPGDFPLSGPSFQGRVSQRTGLSPAARALIEGAAAEGAPLPNTVLDDLVRGGAGGGGPDSFIEDEVTGARFLQSGKTRLPSGVNPARQGGANAVEMVEHPETGQPLGFWVTHAGAKPVWKGLPVDSGLTRDEIAAMNTELRPWGDAISLKLNKTTPEQAEKKIDAIRQKYLDIAARRRSGGAPAADPADEEEPDPAPPSRKSKGKRYWNPEQGILQDTPYAPGR